MWRSFARLAPLALVAALALAGCGPQGITTQGITTQGTAIQGIPPQETTTQGTTTQPQAGGLRVTIQMLCPSGQSCGASAASQMISALQRRASAGLGVSDVSVKQLDATHFEVDLPGYGNQRVGASALSMQGSVLLIDTSDAPLQLGSTVSANEYPVLFTGSQIDPSSVSAGMQSGAPYVTYGFSGAAASRFAQYTGSHIGEYLTMTMDGTVIMSATIQIEIPGEAEVSYGATLDDAEALAACLKSGPLPFPVKLVSASLTSTGAK